MAKAPGGLLVAGSPGGLKEARVRSEKPGDRDPWGRLRLDVEPGAFDGSRSLMLRRLRALLAQARGPVSGRAAIVGSKLQASVTVGVDGPEHPPSVDPDWLDWLPIDGAMAAFAVAIDPSPNGWDAAFRVADLVDKVDPGRVQLAPGRLRLALLAGTMGLRVDGDLLPHLRGVAGWVGGDGKAVDRGLLMFHLDAEAVALRIYEGLRRLPKPGVGLGPRIDSGRWLGRVDGRVIRAYRVGRSVVATWGDGAMEAALEAADHRDRSARSAFAAHLGEPRPAFVAAAWPARVPGLVPPDTPLLASVAEAPPVVGSGTWANPGALRIEADWAGLDDLVRRFLGKIPLDPPTDH